MAKNYFYITLFFILFSWSSQAQESKEGALNSKQEQPLENLSLYPNPVGNGKVYITSKSSAPKDVEIFDVLGKRVMQTVLTTKELNIATLNPGVYIIKIKEGEQRATRKLIIK